MRIDRHIVDQIRDRTQIEAVVARHVRLERRGNSLVGLCPFHQEKSPSFNVVPSKGMYYCFGCQAGGDVFRFLMLVEGLSFVEAVKELASGAGVEIPERELTPDEKRALRARATLYDVLEEAAKYYESVLWTRPEGEAGRAYLKKRELHEPAAQAARVGFAPPGFTNLTDLLTRKGFGGNLLVDAGVAKQKDGSDRVYDAFRDRVVFPIRDEKSRVIGFGGRLLEGDGPKYLNSPETRLYQKSRILYGFETARQDIGRKDRVLVVEGYFDVLSMHQAGFKETVATCGTAITEEHAQRIRRLTTNVIVLTDADEAGSKAAEKVLPMLLAAGLNPWRLQITGAKDPDELVRVRGAAAMAEALDKPEPLVEWTIERKLAARGSGAVAKQRIAEELIPILAQLPDAAINDVAVRLGQDYVPFRMRVRSYRPAGAATEATTELPEVVLPAWKATREQVHLLWLVVHRYNHVADVVQRMDPSLVDEPLRPILGRLLTGEPVAAIDADLTEPEIKRTLQAVVGRADLYPEETSSLAACEVVEKLGGPKREQRIAELVGLMDSRLKEGDSAGYREAAVEHKKLDGERKKASELLKKRDVGGYVALLAAR